MALLLRCATGLGATTGCSASPHGRTNSRIWDLHGSGYVVISRESAHSGDSLYVEVEARAQGYQLHLPGRDEHALTTIVNQIIADEQLQTLGFEGPTR